MKNKEWIATITCTVKKSVTLSGCTEDEARNNPWEYATGEHEMDMSDWEVTEVEPNT